MPVDPSGLETWLTRWMPSQRWFADKSRPITSTRVIASHEIGERTRLLVVRLDFADPGTADYVVPICVSPHSDGTDDPEFLTWLGSITTGHVAWPEVVTRRELIEIHYDLGQLSARPLGVEQSNTSVRFGADWVVKLNRRLSYGPSPELELSTLLNAWDGAPCAPRTAAALSIRTDRGDASLAILAEFVTNQGDGWRIILDALRAEARAIEPEFNRAPSIGEVKLVAELTADFHGALSADPWTSDLAPDRISLDMAGSWAAAADDSLSSAIRLLDASRTTLSGRSRELAELVTMSTPTVRQHIAGFKALVGSQRIRIHGDYHLGQVLRTVDGRYVAIDFDGEPQRSLEERRAKYSPLRDVAGLLRSLAYAAGTIQAESEIGASDAWFPAWERAARSAFLKTYLQRLETNQTKVLPAEPEKIRLALGALELEKALYEVAYELNNRPDWVWIPLSQLVRMG